MHNTVTAKSHNNSQVNHLPFTGSRDYRTLKQPKEERKPRKRDKEGKKCTRLLKKNSQNEALEESESVE